LKPTGLSERRIPKQKNERKKASYKLGGGSKRSGRVLTGMKRGRFTASAWKKRELT